MSTFTTRRRTLESRVESLSDFFSISAGGTYSAELSIIGNELTIDQSRSSVFYYEYNKRKYKFLRTWDISQYFFIKGKILN